MRFLDESPNDPIFYLHHCFVDYIFEEFRKNQRRHNVDVTDYPTNFGTLNHSPAMQMFPFSMTNKDGLSEEYTERWYSYAPRPSCSKQKATCGSKYLKCGTSTNLCVPTTRTDRTVPCRKSCGGFSGERESVNSYCLLDNKGNNYCDEREWAYLPIKIISSRTVEHPTYANGSHTHVPRTDSPAAQERYKNYGKKYQYQPASASSQTSSKASKFCDVQCDCCGGAGKITVQSVGLNYLGEYEDYAIIDTRQPISSGTTNIAIKNPDYDQSPSYAIIRAYDACGNACYATCKSRRGLPSDCLGIVKVSSQNSEIPLSFAETYIDAAYISYTLGRPYFRDGDENFLTFYCNGFPRKRMPPYYERVSSWINEKLSSLGIGNPVGDLVDNLRNFRVQDPTLQDKVNKYLNLYGISTDAGSNVL